MIEENAYTDGLPDGLPCIDDFPVCLYTFLKDFPEYQFGVKYLDDIPCIDLRSAEAFLCWAIGSEEKNPWPQKVAFLREITRLTMKWLSNYIKLKLSALQDDLLMDDYD